MANNKKRPRHKDASGNKKRQNLELQDLPQTSEGLSDKQAEEVTGGARFRPQIEALEDRQMMSASPVTHVAPVQANYVAPVQANYVGAGTVYHIADPIQVKYQSLGGQSGFLGRPLGPEVSTKYGNGQYQIYDGGVIFYSQATGAHWMDIRSYDEWDRADGETNAQGVNLQEFLGLPTNDQASVSGVSGASVTTMQNGDIYSSPATGGHAIYGSVLDRFNSTGGPTHFGLPTTDEAYSLYAPGRFQEFQSANGYITAIYRANQGGNTYVVYADIYKKFTDTNNEQDAQGRFVQADLGAPTSDTVPVPGVAGAFMSTFQGGAIYFSLATDEAHVVYGNIYTKYISAGGPAGYGLPMADEANPPYISGLDSGGVRFQQFQTPGSGFIHSIYWSSAEGAHLIYGAIYQGYLAAATQQNYQGFEMLQALGLVTSDEMGVAGVAGARMNTFVHGALYWSPTTGAHIVAEGFFTAYQQAGGPAGILGLPTSDETPNANGAVIHFQHGYIQWTAANGFQVVHT